MSDFTITIIGAGAVGTSIGLALKQQPDPPRLIAHDKELGLAQQAVKLGAFDKAEWNLINACDPAHLIILAIPVSGIRPTLAALAPELAPHVVISDTCLSKASVMAWAAELLPAHVHFVGGHPLVHPTGTGAKHASAHLFQGAAYCLTPAPTAAEERWHCWQSGGAMEPAPFHRPVGHDGWWRGGAPAPPAQRGADATLSGQPTWRGEPQAGRRHLSTAFRRRHGRPRQPQG